jgi:hypothetical protein
MIVAAEGGQWVEGILGQVIFPRQPSSATPWCVSAPVTRGDATLEGTTCERR